MCSSDLAPHPNSDLKTPASTFDTASSTLDLATGEWMTCTVLNTAMPGQIIWSKVDDAGNALAGAVLRKDVAENLEASFKKLDEEVEKGNGAIEKFALGAAKVQAMSLPTRAAVLDSLSGQIYASAQALTFQHSQTVNKDLSNRLVMLGTLENVGENAGV